ncbi:hypothetical protein IJU97_01140 [bacterium]|nr:hypothetical protein [bacterium]
MTLKATLENAKLKLLIEKVGTLTINDALKNIKAIKNDVNNEWLLELLESEDKSILLYNMDDSYIYTN